MTTRPYQRDGAVLRIIPRPRYDQWEVQEFRKGWFFYGWHHVHTSGNLEDAQKVVSFMRENPYA
jgi:hypothetical protein